MDVRDVLQLGDTCCQNQCASVSLAVNNVKPMMFADVFGCVIISSYASMIPAVGLTLR